MVVLLMRHYRTGCAADKGASVRAPDMGASVRALGAGALGRAPAIGATSRARDLGASSCLKTQPAIPPPPASHYLLPPPPAHLFPNKQELLYTNKHKKWINKNENL